MKKPAVKKRHHLQANHQRILLWLFHYTMLERDENNNFLPVSITVNDFYNICLTKYGDISKQMQSAVGGSEGLICHGYLRETSDGAIHRTNWLYDASYDGVDTITLRLHPDSEEYLLLMKEYLHLPSLLKTTLENVGHIMAFFEECSLQPFRKSWEITYLELQEWLKPEDPSFSENIGLQKNLLDKIKFELDRTHPVSFLYTPLKKRNQNIGWKFSLIKNNPKMKPAQVIEEKILSAV